MRGPCRSIFIERGKEHTFRIVSDIPARHLLILTPGGFEGFFSKMAAERLRIPEDMEEITNIAANYQLTFTGPQLGADLEESIQ